MQDEIKINPDCALTQTINKINENLLIFKYFPNRALSQPTPSSLFRLLRYLG